MNIELPTGDTWRVLAYEIIDEKTAGEEFDRIMSESFIDKTPEQGGDFSVWRTTTPDRTMWAIILCGAPEKLEPIVCNGVPMDISIGEAEMFALRRARTALNAIEASDGEAAAYTHVAHYPHGAKIDRASGGVIPQ